MSAPSAAYDAVLVVSFGGPDHRDDVLPFLENVLRGKPVPRERLLEVAEHYYHFGGVSPINDQCRQFISALRTELDATGPNLPIYWGNRNWHPLLPDVLDQMRRDGVRRAIAFVTSAYSSYSGCRQYRENIAAARETVGPDAPQIDKLRVFYNHPAFVAVNTAHVADALARLPQTGEVPHVLFTAHSIPNAMADNCRYQLQLQETCRLIVEQLGHDPAKARLVYQSRSGRPEDPWLEPDVVDSIRELASQGVRQVVIHPVGFLSDHMEVIYDLDEVALEACRELGVTMERSATVGTDRRFVAMVADLIRERSGLTADKPAIGQFGPSHDVCPEGCCLYSPGRPGRPAPAAAG